MSMAFDLQEALALAAVALVIGVGVWRRWQRRARTGPGCGSCDKPDAQPTEMPLRFYRRKP